MVFGFDPRKLVEEDQEDKNKEVKEAVDSVLTFEEEEEKNEAFIRKQSNISTAIDGAFKALREHKFEKKFGKDAYIDEKIKEDPEYRDPRLYTDEENKTYYRSEMESMKGLLEGFSFSGEPPPVEEMNETVENLSTRLSAAEWHKANLTYELSEAMAQLNQSEDEELMGQLEDQIENLSAQISEADSRIASLNSELTQKQNEINQLNATITALQSTMNSLTYNVRNRVDSCPSDNPGLEMVVGYDDGTGAASPGDGQVNFDEIQFSVGECPGDDGMILEFQNNSA